MKPICNFLNLSTADQKLLLESTLLLGAITLGLRIVPFLTLQRLLGWLSRQPSRLRHEQQPSARRIIWAVRVASYYIPAAVCLSQALTVQLLFRRQGYPADLRIGVAKNNLGQLEAHAWVESQGQIVIGRLQDLSRYSPLSSLERSRR